MIQRDVTTYSNGVRHVYIKIEDYKYISDYFMGLNLIFNDLEIMDLWINTRLYQKDKT
jgi:hypothetical protein